MPPPPRYIVIGTIGNFVNQVSLTEANQPCHGGWSNEIQPKSDPNGVMLVHRRGLGN
jgi:hypothetical protein